MNRDPVQRRSDAPDFGDRRFFRSRDDDDRQPERAGSGDLGIGGRTAGVLGDDDVDTFASSTAPARRARRTARARAASWTLRHRQRVADRLDRAHQIEVLRGRGERAPARVGRSSERRGVASGPSAGTASAIVATSIQRSPGCASHGGRRSPSNGRRRREQASAALRDIIAAKGWVASTTASDAVLGQPTHQTFSAAEAAGSARQRRWARVGGAPGQGQYRVDIGSPGEFLPRAPRLRSFHRERGYAYGCLRRCLIVCPVRLRRRGCRSSASARMAGRACRMRHCEVLDAAEFVVGGARHLRLVAADRGADAHSGRRRFPTPMR